MRTAFREHLDAFSHDLIRLADLVAEMMGKASHALLSLDLQAAEDTLSMTEQLEERRADCEKHAVELLALEGPLARDLRQVVSSIYIVEDLNRMGVLATHIAKYSRRRNPESVIPQPLVGYFEEMRRLDKEMLAKVRNLLVDPDVDVALVLSQDDDAVDDLNNHLLMVLTEREWQHSTTEAVDTALLSRFYERFADHAVNVAKRVVYLTTGMMPADYWEKRKRDDAEADIARKFAELERRFSRR